MRGFPCIVVDDGDSPRYSVVLSKLQVKQIMSFNTLTVSGITFSSVGAGVYEDTALPYGGLRQYIRLSPGRITTVKQPDGTVKKSVKASVTYYSDVDPGGNNDPKDFLSPCVVNIQLSMPVGDYVDLPDAQLSALSSMIDQAFLTRLFRGES